MITWDPLKLTCCNKKIIKNLVILINHPHLHNLGSLYFQPIQIPSQADLLFSLFKSKFFALLN